MQFDWLDYINFAVYNNYMENKKQLQFNVSARTAKLIGLENFANAEGAIIELVKNSCGSVLQLHKWLKYNDKQTRLKIERYKKVQLQKMGNLRVLQSRTSLQSCAIFNSSLRLFNL